MRRVRVAHVTTVDLTHRFLLLGQLRRLRDEGYEVAAISAPGPWAAHLEREGIRHIAWPHAVRAWDPVRDARAFAALARILRRERFDLVHTHTPKAGVLGRLAARAVGVRCVVNTVHGYYAAPGDPWWRRAPVLAAERLAARCSDLELFQSEEDLLWAGRARVVPGHRSVLLGNGTDLTRFDPASVDPARVASLRRELGIPEGAPVVGTIGRLVVEKGYRELFEAARRIRVRRPEARFLAVGSPHPDEPDAVGPGEIEAARRDVVFAGWREDVPELLALMDVFVLASWREGVPRSAIEAAAMGRAMVLTDIRGCREVARDGVEALLVPPRRPDALAGAIERLLSDGELRARLGRAARARAVERFDEGRVAAIVVERYRRLLSAKGLRPSGELEPETVLRPARRSDARALARLHRSTLPRAFLPTLGEGFLATLYRALAADPRAVAIVAEEGREVVGFAAGAVSVRRFYRRFAVRHGPRAALLAAPRLLRPGVVRRARETAAYPARAADLPDAELLAIAVAPGARARGVGTALARGVLDGLAALGAGRVKVVVDADNEPANRLYESLGFSLHGPMAVHRGITSNAWVIGWPSSSHSVSVSS